MTKLLLDENPSRRLAERLQPVFPGTRHVEDLGLRGASDIVLWDVARRGGFMVVSKDDDFRQLGLLRGALPKLLVLADQALDLGVCGGGTSVYRFSSGS